MNYLPYKTLFTISAIVLISINPLSLDKVVAETGLLPAPSLQKETRETLSTTETELPPEIKSAVLEAAASRTSRTVASLKILETQSKNWSDGCLGLAKPDELCTQVITPGWQIVVTDGLRNWTYRTNDTGDVIRLEEAPQ